MSGNSVGNYLLRITPMAQVASEFDIYNYDVIIGDTKDHIFNICAAYYDDLSIRDSIKKFHSEYQAIET